MPCIQFFFVVFSSLWKLLTQRIFFLSALSLSAVGSFFPYICVHFFFHHLQKKCSVRCFAIIICLTWSRFFSSYHWLYLQVCMCKCAWKTKEFPPSNAAKRERGRERFVAFWHGLRMHTKSILSAKHWTFKCIFAPFVWKVVEQIFVLFSSALILVKFAYEFPLEAFFDFEIKTKKNGSTRKKTSTHQWYVIIMSLLQLLVWVTLWSVWFTSDFQVENILKCRWLHQLGFFEKPWSSTWQCHSTGQLFFG